MTDLVNFVVTAEDGGGYSASAVNVFIVTQGDTFDELLTNIKEAVLLYFERDRSTKTPFFNLIYSEHINHA